MNTTPSWSDPPLAIANKYHDHQTNQPKSVRYRLILVRVSDLEWLKGDRLKDLLAHTFFFLECGRCRTVARFLHEHKQ